MRKFLLTIICTLIFANCYSVNNSIDSLLHILKDSKDTNRVIILNKISAGYQYTKPDIAINYGIKAYSEAKELSYYPGMIRALHIIGITYHRNSKFKDAEKHYRLAYKISVEIEDKENIAKSLGSLGILNTDRGDFYSAIEYFEKTLSISKEIQDSLNIAICYQNMAYIYNIKGNKEKALNIFFEVLQIAERKKRNALISATLNNIAVILQEQGKEKEALKYHQKNVEYNKTSDQYIDKLNLGNTYNNIGLCYHNLGNYELGIKYYLLAGKIKEEINDKEGIATAYNNMGAISFDKEKYGKAEKYFAKALQIAKEIEHINSISKYLCNLSDVYRETGQVEKAITFANESLQLSKELESKELIINATHALSKIYSLTKNYKKAYNYYRQYSILKDSLLNERNFEIMEEMRVRYENTQKQQEINLQKKEIDLLQKDNNLFRIKTISYSTILILLLLVGILIIFYQRSRIKKNRQIIISDKKLFEEKLKSNELEKRNLEAELDYKNREIQNFAIHIIEKNEFLDKIKESITKKPNKDKELINLISQNQSIEKDREEFRANIEQVHEAYFLKLSEQFPNLTKNEQRLSALLRMNLSSKEIATLTNISPSSVDMNRHRLRKKLSISKEENITDFLNKI